MPANYEEGRPGGGPKKGSKKGSKMAKNGHFGCTFDYTQGLAGTPFLGVPEGPFCPYFPRLTPSQIGSVLDPILTPWPWGSPGGPGGHFGPLFGGPGEAILPIFPPSHPLPNRVSFGPYFDPLALGPPGDPPGGPRGPKWPFLP